MDRTLWAMLYNLEEHLGYDTTKMGKKLGLFINELQNYEIKIKAKQK